MNPCIWLFIFLSGNLLHFFLFYVPQKKQHISYKFLMWMCSAWLSEEFKSTLHATEALLQTFLQSLKIHNSCSSGYTSLSILKVLKRANKMAFFIQFQTSRDSRSRVTRENQTRKQTENKRNSPWHFVLFTFRARHHPLPASLRNQEKMMGPTIFSCRNSIIIFVLLN